MSHPPSESASPLIEGYDRWQPIAAGGFGRVFRARHQRLDRVVAVKVLEDPVTDRSTVRFERECVAAGRVSHHPNIVSVHDAGITSDQKFYLVMEFMDGGTLTGLIESDGPAASEMVADMGVKLAGALHSAHLAGILHRDIKPDNIVLSREGEPSLTDFGIAHVQTLSGATNTDSVTLAYAAPEQLLGKPSTPTSDVYSLAAVLYFTATGSPAMDPSTAETVPAFVAAVGSSEPPDLRHHGVSQEVASVIRRAMAPSPADRYGSAAEFALALQQAALDDGFQVREPVFVTAGESEPRATREPSDPTIARRPTPHRPDVQARSEPPIPVVIGVVAIMALLLPFWRMGAHEASVTATQPMTGIEVSISRVHIAEATVITVRARNLTQEPLTWFHAEPLPGSIPPTNGVIASTPPETAMATPTGPLLYEIQVPPDAAAEIDLRMLTRRLSRFAFLAQVIADDAERRSWTAEAIERALRSTG